MNDKAEEFSAYFGNWFGRLVGIFSTLILVVSIAYEWGFCWAIDAALIRLNSLSDYLSNAVAWIPFLVFLIPGSMIAGQAGAADSRHARALAAAAEPGEKTPDVFAIAPHFLFASILVITLLWLSQLELSGYALYFSVIFTILWPYGNLFFYFRRRAFDRWDGRWALVFMLGPSVITMAFAGGNLNAQNLVNNREGPVFVSVSGQQLLVGYVIRAYEKGALIRVREGSDVQFFPWEQVSKIHFVAAPKRASLICRVTSLSCNDYRLTAR